MTVRHPIHLENLPFPIELRKLPKNLQSDRISVGFHQFSRVMTFGRIVACKDDSEMACFCYKVCDPIDTSVSMDIFVYKGLSNSTQPRYFDDKALVFVAGKLRRFRSQLAIQAFKLRETEDRQEYDSFVMESLLAWDYHVKVPVNKNRLGDTSSPRTPARTMMGASSPSAGFSTLPASLTASPLTRTPTSIVAKRCLQTLAGSNSVSADQSTEPTPKRCGTADSFDDDF